MQITGGEKHCRKEKKQMQRPCARIVPGVSEYRECHVARANKRCDRKRQDGQAYVKNFKMRNHRKVLSK